MKLPESVIPILASTVQSPLVARNLPLEIWTSPDHRAWVDAFMELGINLYRSDIPEDRLPRGYVLVAYLFDWEAECQSEGWHALANRLADVERIIQAYREVGLAGEADAITRALAAWRASDGDVERTSAAYEEERHDYTVDLDRMEYLASYFVDNAARLFYLPTEA